MDDDRDDPTLEPDDSDVAGDDMTRDDDVTPVSEDVDDPTSATVSTKGAVRPTGKRRASTAGSRAVTSPAGSKRATGRPTARRAVAEAPARQGFITRIGRFLREVVAELRKVIWPTRKELITYTTVVLAFVTFMVALVAGLDILFARGVLAVFG